MISVAFLQVSRALQKVSGNSGPQQRFKGSERHFKESYWRSWLLQGVPCNLRDVSECPRGFQWVPGGLRDASIEVPRKFQKVLGAIHGIPEDVKRVQ